MKAFWVALVLATCVVALPTKSQLSQEELRASLITKDNVAEYLQNQRRKKAMLQAKLPEPFVISTSLNVGRPARQSRTYFDGDGTAVIEGVRMPDDPVKDKVTWRNGRVINNIFVPREAIVSEPENILSRQPKQVELELMVADESIPKAVHARQPQLSRQPKQFDFEDFYKGRNPRRRMKDNMAIESRSDQVYVKPPEGFQQKESRDYNFHAGDTDGGRPVYYVVEEPDSLHSDRSPYDFEPADTHTSLSSHVADYTQSGLTQATSGDFVIKEHSYTMCPGCPTFSIPVPIPKAILGAVGAVGASAGGKVDYQHARNRTFLEKIGDRIVNGFHKVQTTISDVIDPILETGESFLGIEDDENTLQEKIDSPHRGNSDSAGSKSYMPFAIASMAAMAIGGMALFASARPGTQFITGDSSRSLKEEGSLRTLQKSIEKYQEE